MANGENEELNPAEQKQGAGGSSMRNPLSGIEDKANAVKNGAETGQKFFNKTAQSQQKRALKQTGTKATKTMAHSAKNIQRAEKLGKVASKASKVAQTAAKLGKILATVGWIILLILAIIGLLVFILTGLGLIMNGLQEIADSFRKGLVSFIYGSQNFVEDDAILDTLLYLEEMDYDLYGYGFSPVQDPLTEEKDSNGNPTGKKVLTYPSEKFCWAFWDTIDTAQKYSNAYKYIRAYLISDNYAYTVKHQNVTWNTVLSPKGRNGMLAIYHEKNFGEKGGEYSKFEPGAITVNDQGELEIKEKQFNVFTRSVMKYDLDGWTGRYGMPLEFLLSVHLATMAPDLSYEMATNEKFHTEVEILLHEIEGGEIRSAATPKNFPNIRVEYSQLHDINGNFIGDDWRLNTKEAKQMFNEHNGVLESYTGNDYPEYKCSGPPNWSNVQHGNIGEISKDISAGNLEKEMRKTIEKLFEDAEKKVEVKDEDVDNLIIEIVDTLKEQQISASSNSGSIRGEVKQFAAKNSTKSDASTTVELTIAFSKIERK